MPTKLFLICLIILASGFTYGDHLPIVGDDDFPPFSFTDDEGNVTGIDVDTVNEMGRRLNLSFDIQLVPWKRLLNMTEKGAVFGSFSLFKTPERETYSLFTHPVHYSTYKVFSNPSKISKFESLADLFGKRFIIEAGFVISDEFDAAGRRGDIDIVEVYRSDELINRLKRGGIDAFVGNELTTQYKYGDDLKDFNIEILPRPVQVARGAFFVLSKAYPMADKALWQNRITQTLKEMEQDGTQQKIISNYLR